MGINGLSFETIAKQCSSGSRYVRQSENLAQHTLVHPVRELREMAVALVVHTLNAHRLAGIRSLVDVQRRNEQHRHIDGQQHP